MKGSLSTVMLAVVLFISAAIPSVSASGASEAVRHTTPMEKAFAVKDWAAIDGLLKSGRRLSPRDRSLAAGAFWMQNRWDDALKQMKLVGSAYPPTVRPYADLLCALAYERLKRPDEARSVAARLVKPGHPALVRFFGAYALARLAPDKLAASRAYHSMIELAGDFPERRLMALRALAVSGDMTSGDALALLSQDRTNQAALAILEKAPPSPERDYRLGWAAYVAGNNDRAVQLLGAVPADGPWGESAAFYRAVALDRLGRSDEAHTILAGLMSNRSGKMLRQVAQRLAVQASSKTPSVAAAATATLMEAAASEESTVALPALVQVSKMPDVQQAQWAEGELERRFPSSPQTAELLWRRGWKSWLADDPESALSSWELASLTDRASQLPKLLYWRAQALGLLNRPAEAQKVIARLVKIDRFSFYSLTAAPEAPLFEDCPIPRSMIAAPSELERWGFMAHARMELERRTDVPSRMANARICRWLGLDGEAYAALRPVIPQLLHGDPPLRALVEMVWPRPFVARVAEQSALQAVDPALVWSIMRQESAFNPQAVSWAGAVGLMQLMPGTAGDEARRLKLESYSRYDPGQNIALGVSHLAWLFTKFDTVYEVAAAYNGGSGSVARWNTDRSTWNRATWIEAIPYDETRDYVKKVLVNYSVYRRLTEVDPLPSARK